ncbi:MAG: carboxymuconolactone decarboxylase family protein [Pontibacterium sp.]
MSSFPKHEVTSHNANAAAQLQSVQAQYGFVPDLFKYMAEAPTTVEAYMELTRLLGQSSLSAAQAQVIQLALSIDNDCNFCRTAHVAMGKHFKANAQTINALLDASNIEDAKDAALIKLARSIQAKRGWLDNSELEDFYAAGFGHQQVLEVILCVTIKTLSNYSNHLTQPEANPELVAMANA